MDYWWESKTEDGEDLLIIQGLDGYLYRFRATTIKVFEPLSPEVKRPRDSPEDDNRTKICMSRNIRAVMQLCPEGVKTEDKIEREFYFEYMGAD
ncbi:MAG: hypothetical protein ACRDF4_09755 [Rhabdochlamydiaceae bacterium]